MKQKGFTLIELLLVISVISLLSSIFFASSTQAKQKGEDSKKQLQVSEVEKAISLYRNDVGAVPLNYTGNGKDVAREGTSAYIQSMQNLVDKGYIPVIPKSVSGTDYSYWADTSASNAFFGARLSNYTTSSKNSCPTDLLSYESCVDVSYNNYGQLNPPPSSEYILLSDPEATDICRKHSSNTGCYRNSDGIYSISCFSLNPEPQDGSFCLSPAIPLNLYCKPVTDSACSGGSNDYCVCI